MLTLRLKRLLFTYDSKLNKNWQYMKKKGHELKVKLAIMFKRSAFFCKNCWLDEFLGAYSCLWRVENSVEDVFI